MHSGIKVIRLTVPISTISAEENWWVANSLSIMGRKLRSKMPATKAGVVKNRFFFLGIGCRCYLEYKDNIFIKKVNGVVNCAGEELQ